MLLEANQRQLGKGHDGGQERAAEFGAHTAAKQTADSAELEDVQGVIACNLLALTVDHIFVLARKGIPSSPSLAYRRRPVRLRRAALFPQAFSSQSSVGLNGAFKKRIDEFKIPDDGGGL